MAIIMLIQEMVNFIWIDLVVVVVVNRDCTMLVLILEQDRKKWRTIPLISIRIYRDVMTLLSTKFTNDLAKGRQVK